MSNFLLKKNSYLKKIYTTFVLIVKSETETETTFVSRITEYTILQTSAEGETKQMVSKSLVEMSKQKFFLIKTKLFFLNFLFNFNT
ncbi:hypothetical protein BpHYR1_029055 [Brachionus plicatilis]|uniref:Uncharacterized protein n=1 Tax=Brachionus plicatilis TaxID=10195 RepID=A0A3M7QFJ1_BRAPC|nr:hypothetical protein BpHYR1_029055 [Brachionus plicatilis]